jgi:hypothetical protein
MYLLKVQGYRTHQAVMHEREMSKQGKAEETRVKIALQCDFVHHGHPGLNQGPTVSKHVSHETWHYLSRWTR